VCFPALTLALGYLPTRTLVAVATGIAGLGLVAGAALAALDRGSPVQKSARAWAVAYAAGVLVYLAGLELSWAQPDNAVIVTPDGRGRLKDTQDVFLLLFSIGVTLLLGAAWDESHRAAPGRRLKTAALAVAAWGAAMLPLPVLMVCGIYATSVLGNACPVGGEVPAHLLGLICSGAMAGLIVRASAEGVMRGLRP
jgi:cytochrome bd-type quinol oxidase subunit 2